MSFQSFSLDPRILAGIAAVGYTEPTPIQRRAIPTLLEGRDVVGVAQTGTGKTAAFVLPILERLIDGPRGSVRALIIVPTRELADQIHQAVGVLGRGSGLRSATVYGGVGWLPQVKPHREFPNKRNSPQSQSRQERRYQWRPGTWRFARMQTTPRLLDRAQQR